MKTVNAQHSSNVIGAETNLIESKGFPKTLHREGVKSNIFEIEFATSMIALYIVVGTKQLLIPMLIYLF